MFEISETSEIQKNKIFIRNHQNGHIRICRQEIITDDFCIKGA